MTIAFSSSPTYTWRKRSESESNFIITFFEDRVCSSFSSSFFLHSRFHLSTPNLLHPSLTIKIITRISSSSTPRLALPSLCSFFLLFGRNGRKSSLRKFDTPTEFMFEDDRVPFTSLTDISSSFHEP